jgi:hypothetical protein
MKKAIKIFLILITISNIITAQISRTATNAAMTVNKNDRVSALLSTKKMTAFDPAIHGFKFANTFNGVDGSRRYGGLCGGMVYAMLDYYYASVQIPQQTYAPSNRYPLQSYIYKRQAKSAQESNWDKWAELWFNPGGARSSEFFGWGIEMLRPGDRMNELKSMIDQGKPAPLGLYHSDDAERFGYSKGGDHQVMAVGYDFGKYKGDKGQFLEDFKIFIVDPNYPGKILTLKANASARCFYYDNGAINDAWLTYFVNTRYEQFPPLIMAAPANNNTTLYLGICTGKDDLRGGNDNLSIAITFRDGTVQEFPNVNASAVWVSDYNEVVPLNLNRVVRAKQDIQSIRMKCSFGGGFNGDNWDLKDLKLKNMDESITYLDIKGTNPINERMLIKRFTGDDRVLDIAIR